MIPGIVASQMRAAGGVVSGYPEVRGAPVFTGTGSTSVTSLDAVLPVNEAGDLLLVFYMCGNSNQIGTRPTGWNRLSPKLGPNSYTMHWKISAGSESTVTIANAAAQISAAIAIGVKAGTFYSSNLIHTSRVIETFSHPNPPLLSTPWGSQKNLWVAYGSIGTTTSGTVNAYPLPNNNVSAAGTALMGLCTNDVESASLDPSAFTFSSTGTAGAMSVAISPPLLGTAPIPKLLRLTDEIVSSSTSQTIPLPDNWAPGQLCVICTTNSSNTNDAASSGMAGWTQLSKAVGAGTTATHEIWYRILQAGDSDPTLLSSGAVIRSAVVMTYAAGTFDATTPVIETAVGVSTSSTATPAVTASGSSFDGNYLLCSSMGSSGVSGNTRDVLTYPYSGNNLLAATARGTAVCFAPHSSGVTPAASYTLSGTAGWVMVTFLIKAAP